MQAILEYTVLLEISQLYVDKVSSLSSELEGEREKNL